MARPSSIDRLPREIRELVAELRENGRTIEEILDHLRQLQIDISRSAMGRHVQKLDVLRDRLKVSHSVAAALSSDLHEDDSLRGRLNAQLLQAQILTLLGGVEGEAVEMTATDAMRLATTLQRLAGAAKSDVDRAVKIRERLRREDAKKIAELEGELAAEGGAPAERARAALSKVRELLGVPDVAG